MKPEFETIWSRIRANQSTDFTQIRGKIFSYDCRSGYISLSSTNQNIAKSQVEAAYEMVPFKSTTVLQHLRAPSYLYAILMDPRIRRQDW